MRRHQRPPPFLTYSHGELSRIQACLGLCPGGARGNTTGHSPGALISPVPTSLHPRPEERQEPEPRKVGCRIPHEGSRDTYGTPAIRAKPGFSLACGLQSPESSFTVFLIPAGCRYAPGGHLAPRCWFLQQGLANSTCCAMVTWGPRAAPLPHPEPRAHQNVYTHPGGNAFIPSGKVLLGDARLPHPPHALHFPLVLPAQQNTPALCFLSVCFLSVFQDHLQGSVYQGQARPLLPRKVQGASLDSRLYLSDIVAWRASSSHAPALPHCPSAKLMSLPLTQFPRGCMQGPNSSLWVSRGLEAVLGQVSGSRWASPGLSVWSLHRASMHRGPVVLAAPRAG